MSLIQNSITYTSSGQAWVASTAYTNLTLGNYLRLVVANPTGSGKTLYLYNISVSSNNLGASNFKLYRNPTTVVTGTTVTPLNQHMYDGIFTSVANVNFDTSGTDLSGVVQKYVPSLSNQEENYDQELYTIGAGWSLGISVRALLTTNLIITLDWVEI